ncbi:MULTISPECIES: hypothetical protein [unclassified Arthrobacter]|uniref:hypothetical protein n=1 Tax=unclassified Arthrobacter TaxID=235627 RepID=UPI001C8651B0|nr:hypothetical protein [Arthrobacter sp. MAHUQ-56]MBX7442319.1 hypothetical protein [Arthrobacter sp. MAHUQ-56]
MSLAITPRSAAGRWSLLFAGITVLAALVAWIILLPMMDVPSAAWVWHALGQACVGPAASATALGLVGIIHYRERSVLTWATTTGAFAAAVAAGVMMYSAVAQYQ